MSLKINPTLKSNRIRPFLIRCRKAYPRGVRVGLTLGDPAGIGPEIIAKAIKKLGKGYPAELIVIGRRPKNIKLGKVAGHTGKLSIEYINEAVKLWKEGRIDCLVTCPVSKEAINLAGYRFLGHTEYLAHLTHSRDFSMILVNKYLRFGLVTRHLPLKEVTKKLDKRSIYTTIVLTYKAIRDFFKINNPRIAVLGLNPHASDNGILGKEELNIIMPAISLAKSSIAHLDGPLPADSGILKLRQHQYDGAVAMYHDQALISLKLTDRNSGVNLTYGLPFVRTSPLHGTAFDIAGKGKADPSSLIAAIKLAIKCTLNQRNV